MRIISLDGSFIPGQNANIHGTGFGATQDANAYVLLWPSAVGFDSRPISVVSWNDSTITVTIPAGVPQNIPGAFFTVVRPTLTPLGASSPTFTTGVVSIATNWVSRAVEAKNPGVATPPPYANVPVGGVGADHGTTVDVNWLPSGYSGGIAKTQLQLFGSLSYKYLQQALQANV
jgi:hypothetical protein